MIQELNSMNFDQAIKENNRCVVEFFAPWCSHCQKFAPIYEAFAASHGEVTFFRVDSDENQTLVERFTVKTIPTVILFQDGKEVKKALGQSAEQMSRFIGE